MKIGVHVKYDQKQYNNLKARHFERETLKW